MTDFHETWYVGSAWHKCYPRGLSSPNAHILNSLFAYLFRLANYNKGKYQEFFMSYSDKTWYVGRSALNYFPCVLLLLMCMIGGLIREVH